MVILAVVLAALLGGIIGAFLMWWKSPNLLTIRMQEFALRETISASEEICKDVIQRLNDRETNIASLEEDLENERKRVRELSLRLDVALAELGSAAKNIQTLGGTPATSAVLRV